MFVNLCLESDENELARWRLGTIEGRLGNIERYLSEADFRARNLNLQMSTALM